MLTDGFSPTLVAHGVTERVLSILLERTSFRIRILTKNAVVGSTKWLRSSTRIATGSSWAFRSAPSIGRGRVPLSAAHPPRRHGSRALRSLQQGGVPTYGTLCPIFPATLGADLAALVDEVRPEFVEEIWAEPYNDRLNWRVVRDAFGVHSRERKQFEAMFDGSDRSSWSAYAADLYRQLCELLGLT